MTTENLSRKIESWSEFVYSSPNSPQQQASIENMINRRHSVAVSNDLDQLFMNSLPSSWSSNSTDENIRQRSMSLRLDTHHLLHRHSISTASPLTPAYFSPSFLDALKSEDLYGNSDEFMIHEFPNNNQNNNHNNHEFTNNHPWLNTDSPTSSMIQLTTTPSPPSTILYQHPSIPEEVEEQEEREDDSTLKSQLVLNRMIQGENNTSILKPMIERYLERFENERKVMIYTSKVAQKSYGTEKRFLCPPPITVLSGASWFVDDGTPEATVHISGEKLNQNGVIEWNDSIGTLVSKHLHINDADEKRKRVEILVKLTLANGIPLGTFGSKPIKVISKPSKKRQSIKNMELCIHHGTTVSLFNRIRSQTVSTKYLGVSSAQDNTCFVARTSTWDPFVIWLVDTNKNEHNLSTPSQHYPPPPAIALQSTNGPIAIHYNQLVVLQCVTTGLVSPVMIIRKVDKASMVLGGNRVASGGGGEYNDEAIGDPVSQLHKIAFQIVPHPSNSHYNPVMSHQDWILPQLNQPATYLACLDHVVGMHKTTAERQFILSKSDTTGVSGGGGGKMMNRKRRVSYDAMMQQGSQQGRRRVNSLNDVFLRRHSYSSDSEYNHGACWTEDVSDASIWTIVGTDCATYKFWTPASNMLDLNSPFSSKGQSIGPFPILNSQSKNHTRLDLVGQNFTRDIQVWFGNIRAKTDYKSRESISCDIPDINQLMTSPACILTENQRQIPLLFVRGDGVVYNTDLFFSF